jgi:predicted porin
MKKSLLALAVLGAFAGAALAQSSVTVYGMVDVSAQKNLGTKDKTVADDVLGSRIGFRGVEDLGGGLAATFGMENRFNPGSGAANATFWQGYSKAGIQGAFGQIELGRDYAVNFLMVQNQIDPFGGATVAILRDIGMRAGAAPTVRENSQLEYHFSANGFNFGAQVAGSNEAGENAGTASRPYSLAANYAAGPLFVAAGLQKDANGNKDLDIGARYNFGFATVVGGYSVDTIGANKVHVDTGAVVAAGTKQKGALIGAIVPMGSGNVKVGYAKAGNGVASKFGLGYDYLLSKRTTLFVDYAHDSKNSPLAAAKNAAYLKSETSAYDLGIKHTF